MSLEFDPACSTVQPEDSLQLFVPAMDFYNDKNNTLFLEDGESPPMPYWPVLHKFNGRYLLFFYNYLSIQSNLLKNFNFS